MDKLKVRLEESQSRESEAKEKVHHLERELSEKTASVHHLESELRQQRRALEQARSREQRLAHEVREVGFSINLHNCSLARKAME